MAFLLLREAGLTNFYVGTPCWSNYGPMITHVGSKYSTYTHYDESLRGIDFDAVLEALQNAPSKSVFLFQACCHNPTGADFSKDQWKQIASIVKSRDIFPVFDIAYQGFSSGDKDVDAWPVRYFYEQNLEFFANHSPRTWDYTVKEQDVFMLWYKIRITFQTCKVNLWHSLDRSALLLQHMVQELPVLSSTSLD